MPKLRHWILALVVATSLLAPALTARAQVSTNQYFNATWERTDSPVAGGQVSRTWMWGPEPFTDPLLEPYVQAPGGEREVQYYDKSRMEITNPFGDTSSLWYVTNGLLVVEMTSGNMQTGHSTWVTRSPADVNVAGDAGDIFGPTYETIGWNIEDGHTYSDGQLITGVIDWLGYHPDVSAEMYSTLAAYGVTAGPYSPETGKHTASVFWDFMTSSALVYQDGSLVNAPLFEEPYYATGLPIDQAWWAEVRVAGTYQWVLVQCFERRCLTYTPGNPEGWQVEAGNVGQHYYTWRYEGGGEPPLSEADYLEAIWDIDDEFLESVEYVDYLWSVIDLTDPTWVSYFTAEMVLWRELTWQIYELNPPASYAQIHTQLLDAYDYIWDASDHLQRGVETGDIEQIDLGWEYFDIGWDLLADAFDTIMDLPPPLSADEYLDLIWAIDDEFLASYETVETLWVSRDFNDQNWVNAFIEELDYWRDLAWGIGLIDPPSGYAEIHTLLVEAYDHIWDAANLLEFGIEDQDDFYIEAGWVAFDLGWDLLDEIFEIIG